MGKVRPFELSSMGLYYGRAIKTLLSVGMYRIRVSRVYTRVPRSREGLTIYSHNVDRPDAHTLCPDDFFNLSSLPHASVAHTTRGDNSKYKPVSRVRIAIASYPLARARSTHNERSLPSSLSAPFFLCPSLSGIERATGIYR